MTQRGISLGLTAAQRANRAKYLGGLADSSVLDASVVSPAPQCIDGYYRLHGAPGEPAYNGGKDPTALDPFDRWRTGTGFVARTADCIGGASWCGGFDRYQTQRFAHLYDGWINTDSMLLDACGPAKCFVLLDRPEPGCFLVAPTGSPGFEHCGHIATVHAVPAEWDHDTIECWRAVGAVDVADRGEHRANAPANVPYWFNARETKARRSRYAAFIRPLI